MAETRTPRFELPQWGSGTDSPSRSDFNEAFLNIETYGARDQQGTFALRPAFGVRGRYYWDTTNSLLYRDTGTAWVTVGARTQDSLALGSAASAVPLTARAAASATADIASFQNNASTALAAVGPDGSIRTATTHLQGGGSATAARLSTASLSVIPASATAVGLVVRGVASQTGDLLKVQNSGGTDVMRVTSDGSVIAPNVSVTGTPSADGHAVSRSYADGRYYFQSGGALNGPVTLVTTGQTNVGSGVVGAALGFRTSREAVLDTTGLSIAATGQVQVGGATVPNGVTPLVVTGPTGQTANYLLIRSAAGTELLSIDRYGNISANNFNFGTIAQRDALTNMAPGALWYDTALGTYTKWDGTGWSPLLPTEFSASAITSGVLAEARIPELGAGKITSGVLDLARIPAIPFSKISGVVDADTVNGKKFTVSTTAPSGPSVGDLWFQRKS